MDNKKLKSSWAAAFTVASVWFGTHVGAGFATGNQVVNYFVQYGWTAAIFPLLAMGILAVVMYIMMKFAKLSGFDNYKDTYRALYPKPWMEIFFEVCPCRIIGVTGSDGKTTTTTLISEMLKNAGYTVHLGGNIGKPLLSEAGEMSPEDVAVLELSSFQLMTLQTSPDIAVFTNLSPNHLDIHKSMEEYAQAKENIFSHQTKSGIAIFNRDNALTNEMAGRAPGKVLKFSRQTTLAVGTYVENGKIVATSTDLTKATYRLARSMCKKDSSFVTIISGCDVSDEEAEKLTEIVKAKCPNHVEVSHIRGGQPVYYYMISVE